MKSKIIAAAFIVAIVAVPAGIAVAAPDAAPAVTPATKVAPGTPASAPTAPVTPPAKAEPASGTSATAAAPGTAETLQAEGEQKWWQALVFDVVFKAIVPIFVPVLAALLLWLLRKVGLKVELETLDKIAGQAADYAEQKGAEWLKENGKKSEGAKKEEWAWELVESIDEKLKGREKARKKLRGMILSKIPDAEKKVADAGAAARASGAVAENGEG